MVIFGALCHCQVEDVPFLGWVVVGVDSRHLIQGPVSLHQAEGVACHDWVEAVVHADHVVNVVCRPLRSRCRW